MSSQTEYIAFLTKQLVHAQKEISILKASLTRQTLEAGKSFQDLREEFDELAQQIYDVIVYWVHKLQRPLTYDEILKYYKWSHPKTKYVTETITRRVRELAEQGWLHSPQRGTFIPITKSTEPSKPVSSTQAP